MRRTWTASFGDGPLRCSHHAFEGLIPARLLLVRHGPHLIRVYERPEGWEQAIVYRLTAVLPPGWDFQVFEPLAYYNLEPI